MIDNLKTKKKTVGFKQSVKAIQAGKAEIVYLARDCDKKIQDTIVSLCEKHSAQLSYADSMKLLGKASGIDVGASVVCLLKDTQENN